MTPFVGAKIIAATLFSNSFSEKRIQKSVQVDNYVPTKIAPKSQFQSVVIATKWLFRRAAVRYGIGISEVLGDLRTLGRL